MSTPSQTCGLIKGSTLSGAITATVVGSMSLYQAQVWQLLIYHVNQNCMTTESQQTARSFWENAILDCVARPSQPFYQQGKSSNTFASKSPTTVLKKRVITFVLRSAPQKSNPTNKFSVSRYAMTEILPPMRKFHCHHSESEYDLGVFDILQELTLWV